MFKFSNSILAFSVISLPRLDKFASDNASGLGLELDNVFRLDLDSVFVIFSIFHYFFFAMELLNNAALCLLIYYFCKNISIFLVVLSFIFFQAMTLLSILFFFLADFALALFFFLATFALAHFFFLTYTFFFSFVFFLALAKFSLFGMQYYSIFKLLPD